MCSECEKMFKLKDNEEFLRELEKFENGFNAIEQEKNKNTSQKNGTSVGFPSEKGGPMKKEGFHP